MKLIIYTLNGCKNCLARQKAHNELCEILEGMDIETVGIMFGEINGVRYEPYPEHDQLCRKPGNPMAYTAPVYILECDDAIVALDDFGKYRRTDKYAEYIAETVASIENSDE